MMFTQTNTGLGCTVTTGYINTCPTNRKGVYEYIIYLLEEGEFELLEEGKIYANSEDGAREKVLFNFAKSEKGKNWDLEDLNIKIRFF